MSARHLFPFLLLLILSRAPARAVAQDSITVLVDLSGGAYGSLGSHALGRRTGSPRDTLAAIKVPRGQRLAYHFAARPDWNPPVLELMGHGLVPADSTLSPEEPLILVVGARRIPKLTPGARRWYTLYVQALRSPDSSAIYQEMLCETLRLFESLPQDSALLVTDWARELGEAEVSDTHAVARLDSLLGGKFYELKCQPKQ